MCLYVQHCQPKFYFEKKNIWQKAESFILKTSANEILIEEQAIAGLQLLDNSAQKATSPRV